MSKKTKAFLLAIIFATLTVTSIAIYGIHISRGNDGLIVTTFLSMLIFSSATGWQYGKWEEARNNEKVKEYTRRLSEVYVVRRKPTGWGKDLLDEMRRTREQEEGRND